MVWFDLYETICKFFIADANKRQDLRIFIDVGLKVAMIGIWHLYLFEYSRLTAPALVTCIIIWPFYHIYSTGYELNDSRETKLKDRRVAFRKLDQIQNFILLVGFAVLVFRDGYKSIFHIATLVVLILDFFVFILQILISYCKKADPSHNYQPTLPTATAEDQQLNQNKQNQDEIVSKRTPLCVFYLFFIAGAIFANIYAVIIMTKINMFQKGNLALNIIVVSQIIGNAIIVFIGVKLLINKTCRTGSCFKFFSTILQGFVFGATSIMYGIIFGIIIVLYFMVFYFCKQKDKQGIGDSFERECYLPYINWLDNLGK